MPALDPDQAAAELRRMASDDKLDVTAVNAVLAAAGDKGRPVRRRWPADLTDREVDVLRRIAVGGSIQAAAADLHLAPKTVDFHPTWSLSNQPVRRRGSSRTSRPPGASSRRCLTRGWR